LKKTFTQNLGQIQGNKISLYLSWKHLTSLFGGSCPPAPSCPDKAIYSQTSQKTFEQNRYGVCPQAIANHLVQVVRILTAYPLKFDNKGPAWNHGR